jgi:tetratricopeptide (TPR) repeat protein
MAPDAPAIAFALAALTRGADPAGASEVVASALEERADYIPLHFLDAVIAAEHDEKPRGVTSVRKALTFDPALYAQHTLFSAYGEPTWVMLDVARSLAEQSNRLDNTILKSAAGALYVLANDQKNGPLWLTKALRNDPNDVGAHFYSAILNLRRGQKKPARLDLAAAEKGERRQPMVRLYKARVFEQIGRYPEATKIYRDLVDQNPLNAAAFVGLGRVLRLQGDEQAARDAGRKALAVRPRDREALRLLVADAGGSRRDTTAARPRR